MKLFTSFNTFVEEKLFENVIDAKRYMANRALKKKKSNASEEELMQGKIGLTPKEVREAETDPEFLKIRELCKNNLAWTNLFTKMYFEDFPVPKEDEEESSEEGDSDVEVEMIAPEERLAELRALMKRLEETEEWHKYLPMPVVDYVSKKAIKEEKANAKVENRKPRKPVERLGDDLTQLYTGHITRKWINRLFTWQKEWFRGLPEVRMQEVSGIAKSFDDLERNTDGTRDDAENEKVQRSFFGDDGKKVLRFRTLSDLLTGAKDFLKSTANASYKKYKIAIDDVNDKYGESNGIEMIKDEDGIMVYEVKSFQANKALNAHTDHCITKTLGSWVTYLGEEKMTKQYYICNWNIDQSDPMSIIGVTIGFSEQEKGGYITHMGNKQNRAIDPDKFQAYMKSINVPFELLAPMSEEEVKIRRTKIQANKEIIKPNISLERMKELYEAGADPNAKEGTPLVNAVKEDDLEKAKYLLEMGAMPNFANAIDFAKNLDMIKLLVEFGSEVSQKVFRTIINDYDAVKYILERGADPNGKKDESTGIHDGYPLKQAAQTNNIKLVELLLRFNADIGIRKFICLQYAVEHGALEIIRIFMDRLVKYGYPDRIDPKTKAVIKGFPRNPKSPERTSFIETFIYYADTSPFLNTMEVDDPGWKRTPKQNEVFELLSSYINQ